MYPIRKSIRLLLLGATLVLTPQLASAKNLTVNLVLQRTTDPNGNAIGNNWCWAGCSKMILDYYGYTQTLEEVVTYGIGDVTYDTWNYGWGTGTEARTGVGVWERALVRGAPTGPYVLQSKTIAALNWKGNDDIIKHFSEDEVQTQRFAVALSSAEITKEIDERDAPMIRRIGWDAGGGHFTVLYGTTGAIHSIRDPWFGSYVASDALMRRGKIGGGNYTWTHTLTTSKILDVLFLFDTTGSMGPYISNAKASASALLDKIASKFKNYRVAVANYKDFPQSPYGDSGDYVYRANQVFTSDKATAQAGINSVPGAGGGNNVPESVYSALFNGLNGTGIGAWREDPAKRIIILIADAPGHDPEPYPGGHSFGEVRALATSPALPISVHCLWAGTNINAGTQFDLIAGETGGSVVASPSGIGTGPGLDAIVESVAASPRFPKGETSAIYPTFVFEPNGVGGMAADATALVVEVQKFDPKKEIFKRMRLINIKDPKLTLYQSTKPFVQGEYRWRLGFKRPGGKLFLPSVGEEVPPDGVTVEPEGSLDAVKATVKTAAKVTLETEFTEFARTENLPANPLRLAPASSFTATDKVVEFSFGAVPGATKYVLQVLQTIDGQEKVVKSAALKPPKNDPSAAALTKTLKGFKVDEVYRWRVQALNFDRPKVDEDAW
jgi:hypothetical protein